MNKLNTFLSFVLLSFCLLINVSYAEIPANTEVAIDTNFGFYNASTFGDYSASTLLSYFSDYYNKDDETSLDTLLSIFSDAGFSRYVISRNTDGNNSYIYLYFLCDGNDVGYELDGNGIPKNAYYSCDGGTQFYQFYIKGSTKTFGYISSSKNKYRSFNLVSSSPTMSYEYDFSSEPIKIVTLRITDTSQYYITWDGTSYYQVSNPSTPTMPTNAEISHAVQAFYNSDYYKNNKDFKEFFVLYNSLKGIYSFVGHNSVGEIVGHFEYGSTLSQHIYSENYPSNTTGVRYWKFNLETLGSQISNFFNNYYWLYSSYDNGTNFVYNGKGYVTDLVDVKFDSRYSTIVYSSIDYLCRIYNYENDEETTEDATISGDEYTYDENLDPTTNEYNPIENFVPVNPSQTILGNADFEGFMKIFNENKEYIVLPGNANWIILANNSLFNHFSSFIVMCTIFIIIERFMRG